jgi:hypothetical protein
MAIYRKLSLALLMVVIASAPFAQTATGTGSGATSGSTGSVDAAKTDPASQYSEADRPEDNYLAKFHAQDVVEKLMKRNLDEIFTLKVITENYKDKHPEWKDEYQKCYDSYKLAMDLYYRRNIVYSRVKLEENKKMINQFFQKISDAYRQDVLEILNNCASNILELTLDANTASDPKKNKILFHNKMRLRVAYGQFDDADRQRSDEYFSTSIFHFRVAKTYGIRILEEINPKEFRGKYDRDKADNRNRIWDPNKKTTASEYSNLKETEKMP